MAAKKYLALLFYTGLVALLFYFGINLAEQGSKSLLGVEDPPRAFRVVMPQDDRGELEIFWSGHSRTINISFIAGKAGDLKNRMHSLWEGSFIRGSQEEGGEDP